MRHYQVNNEGKLYIIRNDLEKIGNYTLRVRQFNENCLRQGLGEAIKTLQLRRVK